MKDMTTRKEASNAAAQLGRRGGKAVAKRGKAYMKALGKKGAKKRWANKPEHGDTPKATKS